MFDMLTRVSVLNGATVFIDDNTQKVLLMVITDTYSDDKIFTGEGAEDELIGYGIEKETDSWKHSFSDDVELINDNGITGYFLEF